MVTLQELGKNITQAREESGISIDSYALATGIPKMRLVDAENGEKKLTVQEIQEIARVLDKPVSFFFGEYYTPTVIKKVIKTITEGEINLFAPPAQGYEIPLLDELLPSNVADQVSRTRKKYLISPLLADEMESLFAIHTSDIGTFDLDIPPDTTLVCSTTIRPINFDKVLVFHNSQILVRNYYKEHNSISFRTTNPSAGVPRKQNGKYVIAAVIVAIEKRL